GLIAGRWLLSPTPARGKLALMVATGLAMLATGLVLDETGICPSVKRIWTPSWVLFSGGCCFLLLAGFYAVIDATGKKRWSFPLVVIGMNSIAAYCLAHLLELPWLEHFIGIFAA